MTAIGLFSYLRDAYPITNRHLYTAVSIYLLIGIIWFAMYNAIDILTPGSIVQSSARVTDRATEILYFSSITLSTVGYGDIVPVHPEVRMLAAFEGIIGVLYIAILVAILVSSYEHRPARDSAALQFDTCEAPSSRRDNCTSSGERSSPLHRDCLATENSLCIGPVCMPCSAQERESLAICSRKLLTSNRSCLKMSRTAKLAEQKVRRECVSARRTEMNARRLIQMGMLALFSVSAMTASATEALGASARRQFSHCTIDRDSVGGDYGRA